MINRCADIIVRQAKPRPYRRCERSAAERRRGALSPWSAEPDEAVSARGRPVRIFRFALSKKREYLADAGSAEMTKNPLALATALEKISKDPCIEAVNRKDVAQMFIDNPKEKQPTLSGFSLAGVFSTHPPIEKRIALLRQF